MRYFPSVWWLSATAVQSMTSRRFRTTCTRTTLRAGHGPISPAQRQRDAALTPPFGLGPRLGSGRCVAHYGGLPCGCLESVPGCMRSNNG